MGVGTLVPHMHVEHDYNQEYKNFVHFLAHLENRTALFSSPVSENGLAPPLSKQITHHLQLQMIYPITHGQPKINFCPVIAWANHGSICTDNNF